MGSKSKKNSDNNVLIITSVDGEDIPFSSVDDLIGWSKTEGNKWLYFSDKFEQAVEEVNLIGVNTIRVIVEQLRLGIDIYQLQPFENLHKSLLLAAKNKKEILDAIRVFNSNNSFVSSTNQGRNIYGLVNKDIIAASYLLSVLHPKLKVEALSVSATNYNDAEVNKKFASALSYAQIMAFNIRTGLQSEIENKNQRLDDIIKRAETKGDEIGELFEKYDIHLSDVQEKLNHTLAREIANFSSILKEKADDVAALLKRHDEILIVVQEKYESKIKSLQDTYETEFGVREAVVYWEDEKKQFSNNAILWSVALVGTMVIALFNQGVGITFVTSILDGLKLSDKSQLAVMLIVSFPIFLVVWLLRICARNVNCNIRYMNEAKHRLVLTKTFLALMAGGQAEKEDRILILNALYQPLDKPSDDGMPPNWYTLLMERMSKDVGRQ